MLDLRSAGRLRAGKAAAEAAAAAFFKERVRSRV